MDCLGVAGALCWTRGGQQALESPRKARLRRDGEMLGRGAPLRLEARGQEQTVDPTDPPLRVEPGGGLSPWLLELDLAR